MYHILTATVRLSRLRYITGHVVLHFLSSLSSLMSNLLQLQAQTTFFPLLKTRGIGYEVMLLIVSGPN